MIVSCPVNCIIPVICDYTIIFFSISFDVMSGLKDISAILKIASVFIITDILREFRLVNSSTVNTLLQLPFHHLLQLRSELDGL